MHIYGVNVEIRGQTQGADFSLHHYVGSEIKLISSDLCSKPLYPLSCVLGNFTHRAVSRVSRFSSFLPFSFSMGCLIAQVGFDFTR